MVKPRGDDHLIVCCDLTPDGRVDYGSARTVMANPATMDRDYPLVRPA